MRVLFINQVYWPDVAATAQHADDLARHLVRHGHEVHVIASRSLYGSKGAALPKRELQPVYDLTIDPAHPGDAEPVGHIHVHRVGMSLFGKSSIVARIADFGFFYLLAMLKAFTVRKPDVVVPFTTPPFIALVGWLMRTLRGSRYVYWVMDLYPDLPVACGVMKERALTTRFFEAVNRFCLRRANTAVVLGRCMKERVESKGVPASNLVHIGVWSPTTADPESMPAPTPPADNPYRKEWDLGDRFVVMYSGNFGLGHDVDTMCRAAEALDHETAWKDRVRFLFVGGGKKKAIVERFVREHALTNCVLADYQPRERLSDSLATADLHLASLLEGVEGIMVPCKLFGIMAAARPCVFIGHPSSELARVLEEHDAGFNVRQGDPEALVSIIKDLADDPARRAQLGENAYKALTGAYDRENACTRWRELLERVATNKA